MKRLWLFLIFLVVIICLNSSPILALDAITGVGVGSILQKNHHGEFSVEIDADFPVMNAGKKGYTIFVSTSIMFADREFEGTKEFQALKVMAAYRKPFGVADLFIETSGGFWFINDSEKEDQRLESFGIALGYTEWGLTFKVGAEFVPIMGPNIWYPYFKLNLLAL